MGNTDNHEIDMTVAADLAVKSRHELYEEDDYFLGFDNLSDAQDYGFMQGYRAGYEAAMAKVGPKDG